MTNLVNKKYYIIGAGISGLALAHKLASSGKSVYVFEASPHLGGRLRSYYDEKLQSFVDNGNHLILNSNKNAISLINQLGAIDRFNQFNLLKDGMKFHDYGTNSFSIIRNISDFFNGKISFKTLSTLCKILFCNRKNYTVEMMYKCYDVFYTQYLDLLSRSILNTKSDIASANMLNKVLRKLAISYPLKYYYPIKNWGDALISPLEKTLRDKNVDIKISTPLKSIEVKNGKVVTLIFDDQQSNQNISCENDIVIFATPPNITSQICGQHINSTLPNEFSPILNIHFKLPDVHQDIHKGTHQDAPQDESQIAFSTTTPLAPSPLETLHNTPIGSLVIHPPASSKITDKLTPQITPKIVGISNCEYLDWIFVKKGFVSTTCSAVSDDVLKTPKEQLAVQTWHNILKIMPELKNNFTQLPPYRVLVEKRATMLCTPAQNALRPSSSTNLKNLYLTGDYVKTGIPATIESAITSAYNLAKSI